jgi:hypothetical protein
MVMRRSRLGLDGMHVKLIPLDCQWRNFIKAGTVVDLYSAKAKTENYIKKAN